MDIVVALPWVKLTWLHLSSAAAQEHTGPENKVTFLLYNAPQRVTPVSQRNVPPGLRAHAVRFSESENSIFVFQEQLTLLMVISVATFTVKIKKTT